MRRGQEIEQLHRISCDPALVPAVRCFAAGACEALSSQGAEPEAWQLEDLDDAVAFARGWRAVRDGTINLAGPRQQKQISAARAFGGLIHVVLALSLARPAVERWLL